ncbi:MAG: hypothetical protein DLM73_08415 [Chthoniobacterales bacterium]|nr:MAG: hypothetical protein DLM73_08415 [Chthoniobacterales bacterium]
MGRGNPKRLRALKFVSVIRRTCSLSNAAENVQHRNFPAAKLLRHTQKRHHTTDTKDTTDL